MQGEHHREILSILLDNHRRTWGALHRYTFFSVVCLTYETDYVYDLIIANYFHNVSLNIHRTTLPSPGFVC